VNGPGGGQLRLGGGATHNLNLFSEHFLKERLPEWPEYHDAEIGELQAQLSELWKNERSGLAADANEAQTEDRFIKPVLSALGFEFIVQSDLPAVGSRRRPDYALYLDPEAREEATLQSDAAVYSNAVAVADAKRFDRPLKGRDTSGGLSDDPEAQIVHYISVTKCPWGVLTNGRLWRLYAAAGDLVAGAHFEIDLVHVLEAEDSELFRRFVLMFGADSFRPGVDGLTLLDRLLEESDASSASVGAALQEQVFAAVPLIAEGLLDAEKPTQEALDAAFEHALIMLYRLLFCLYAEARDLLPIQNRHYREYSLRKRRAELAEQLDAGRTFSRVSDDLYNDLRSLFRIVDQGDDDLAVNEYDGGLFDANAHPYFEGRWVSDALLAPALDKLFRVNADQVDYRDLSVRHLGTIYERLLAYELTTSNDGLTLADSPRRHGTGSYFTPRPVVDRIVERTLEPILARRSGEIADAALTGDAALERFLELRVLDPAMGSAHFLVAAAGYISQYIATDPSYDGDLDWQQIQRLVAERCLYGVDLEPMAVELANLSLWLTTVSEDEPLTFLSNLRVGNSLVGAQVEELLAGGETIFSATIARDVERMLGRAGEISATATHRGADVDEKRKLQGEVDGLREPLERFATSTIADRFPELSHQLFHWELEFPEVFLDPSGRRKAEAGFDAVVGNPPYIRIQEFGRQLASYCRERYDVASGSFDAYVVFLERSLSLLAPDGRLGFIVPNKFTKLEAGAKLRELLATGELIEDLIDFADAQVFAGATNYTCILVLTRTGTEGFDFRKLPRTGIALREALTDPDSLPAERFLASDLGDRPWVLASGSERVVLDALRRDSTPLGELAASIFTGLQTGADPVYIVEDRGERGGNRMVYSKASDQVVALEPNLLHPLASGGDVEPYAFKPLASMLLFPYGRDAEGEMRPLTEHALERFPGSLAYLRSHEEALRGRERGKMDHEGWFQYTYPKSLGKHDLPKLGVPRLCERLRASIDKEGGVYLDNVDVNGIQIQDGIDSFSLLLLLNSRALDFMFRRVSVPFRGAFMSANKQFIAPLPIRAPTGDAIRPIEAQARELHASAHAFGAERAGFLGWLEGAIGAPVSGLQGQTRIRAYDTLTLDELLGILRSNRARLGESPDSRAFRDAVKAELAQSAERLAIHRRALEEGRLNADDLVYDLYELSDSHRRLIDAEYEQAEGWARSMYPEGLASGQGSGSSRIDRDVGPVI